MSDPLGNFFNQLFQGGEFSNLVPFGRALAAMDRFIDTEGNLVYKIDLPGISREDIQLKPHPAIGNALLLQGERKSEILKGDLVERPWGKFERILAVPSKWDLSQLEANLADGVLVVIIPVKEIEETDSESFKIN